MVTPHYFRISTKFSADFHLRALGYYVFTLAHTQKPTLFWFFNYSCSKYTARSCGLEGYANDKQKRARTRRHQVAPPTFQSSTGVRNEIHVNLRTTAFCCIKSWILFSISALFRQLDQFRSFDLRSLCKQLILLN